MRLLIFTQALDKKDPILGVYHDWIKKIAEQFESVIIICLKKGVCDMPSNVIVLSLGKEDFSGILNTQYSILNKIRYGLRFYKYIWQKRHDYDSVFVHMNQEYVLLGGLFWKLLGKKVYMWRNHHSGSFLTDIAAGLCDKVFCTSKFSYTAKYKKTILMPVGIDTERFKKQDSRVRTKNSILFLGRIAPVKRPDVLIEALEILKDKGVSFCASIYGDPLPKDTLYYESLKKLAEAVGISGDVTFFSGVPNDQTVDVYNSHEIFVNLSPSGMYDKTIFEAMACETLTLVSNENLRGEISDGFIFKDGEEMELSQKIKTLLARSQNEKEQWGKNMREYVILNHSLKNLAERVATVLKA